MVLVSRRPLPKHIEEKIFYLFFQSLANLKDPSDVQRFLFDLLSPVERTMLAKRLAIAILLSKGHQYESIKDMLKVSQETIARVNMVLQSYGDGYKLVIKKTARNELLENLFDKIGSTTIKLLPNSSLKKELTQEKKLNK